MAEIYVLTLREVADYLQCSLDVVRLHWKEWGIPFTKSGASRNNHYKARADLFVKWYESWINQPVYEWLITTPGRKLIICGATDGPNGRCTLPRDHDTNGWHQEWRGSRLWAEWRGPKPGETCNICGKDGSEH